MWHDSPCREAVRADVDPKRDLATKKSRLAPPHDEGPSCHTFLLQRLTTRDRRATLFYFCVPPILVITCSDFDEELSGWLLPLRLRRIRRRTAAGVARSQRTTTYHNSTLTKTTTASARKPSRSKRFPSSCTAPVTRP